MSFLAFRSQENVNQKLFELWFLMIHKVILQTQQGNIRFANCLNDIFAITLNYCCSKSCFTIFQLDNILKLYFYQDKYSTFYLLTWFFLTLCLLKDRIFYLKITYGSFLYARIYVYLTNSKSLANTNFYS